MAGDFVDDIGALLRGRCRAYVGHQRSDRAAGQMNRSDIVLGQNCTDLVREAWHERQETFGCRLVGLELSGPLVFGIGDKVFGIAGILEHLYQFIGF